MILVAIGGNLPGADGRWPLAVCRDALEAIRAIPGLRLLAASRWYQTAPVPPSDQPDYVNAVVRLEGEIAPERLLARLQEIEARAGRVRSVPNAARTLDLDIIAMGNLIRDDPALILPHPRAHQRAFVLRPLAEVAPGWVHPRLGRSVEELIAELPAQEVRVL